MKLLITGLMALSLMGCVTTTQTESDDTALRAAEKVICEEVSTGVITRNYNTLELYTARKII